MEVRTDYKFQASVSTDAFVDKTISSAMIGSTRSNPQNKQIRKEYGFRPNRGVGYKKGTFTPQELLDKLTEGHVFCHIFEPMKCRRRKDGSFGNSEKRNENFRCSYIIGIDIDETNYKTAEDFIEKLELKPTFYYTSYRNQQDGLGARFRLIYIFNKPITSPYLFRYLSSKLHNKIEKDTKEKIKDKCGLNCTQYFNGTNRHNKDIIFSSSITNIIYSLLDIPSVSKDDFLYYLEHKCFYKKSLSQSEEYEIRYLIEGEINFVFPHTSYNECPKNEHNKLEVDKNEIDKKEEKKDEKTKECSATLISDMARLSYDEFMKYHRHKYCYFYRVEKEEWIDFNDKVKYQNIDENYFSLYYNVSKICDGHNRRKKLYHRMCLRRVINPSVDADTLLFNAYEDLHRFFDNDSQSVRNVITIDELVKNVKCAMEKNVSEIEDGLSDMIKYLKSKRPKFGRIYKFQGVIGVGERNTLIKDVRWTLIAEYYDCSISLKGNVQVLKAIGVDVSEKTLQRFCKKYGISTKGDYDKVIMVNYNFNFPLRRNHSMLIDMGFKVSLGKLSKLVKEYKGLDMKKVA